MNTLILFLLAFGLAMDCFTLGITNSSASGLVKPGSSLKTAIAFTFAHILFLFGGYWLGGALQPMFAGQEMLIAFIIFVVIGSKMIMEARRRHPKSKVFDINQAKVIVVLSLATAMDALLAGLAIGIARMNIHQAWVMVAVTVFILTLGGMAGGKQLGVDFARRTAYFGGIFILVAAALSLFQFI